MPKNIKKKVINNKDVSFLNRDFESFRNELIRYSKTHYGDKVLDYGESSLAGLFVDMAAYIGDVTSYYLDHQFNELSLETAVEESNIARLIRQSGVDTSGASPSIVNVICTITVDAVSDSDGNKIPDTSMITTVKIGTIVESKSGVSFELLDNLDYSKKDVNGEYVANVEVLTSDSAGSPLLYTMTRKALFTSSTTTTESIAISTDNVPFRTVPLSNINVSEVISVIDSDNDEYYEVQSLTQNTVFYRETNTLSDNLSVPERLKIIPAPKRFVKFTSRDTGVTTLRFGSGNEDLFDEDVIPDPSDHAVPLYGDRKTVSFATIDPNSFLGSRTLGVSPKNTTLKITYRSGGGVNHNVAAGQITSVKTLVTKFSESTSPTKIARVRASFSIVNGIAAAGGENEPTLNELKQLAFSTQNAQNRIVTREDLLARVYSLPNNFGRVFRAGIRDNPFNPFSSHLHVISRDENEKLVISPDSLKENISTFLSKYRLISDAIDIVDALIINIGIDYVVSISSKFNSDSVIQTINSDLKRYFNIKNFQIDQPIYISEAQNLIINTPGVIHLEKVEIKNYKGFMNENSYSNIIYTPNRYYDRGVFYPIPGGIFEVKFPNDDIKGRVK